MEPAQTQAALPIKPLEPAEIAAFELGYETALAAKEFR
jgi:hypothetical protein